MQWWHEQERHLTLPQGLKIRLREKRRFDRYHPLLLTMAELDEKPRCCKNRTTNYPLLLDEAFLEQLPSLD
jgi:hypothetical protein